MAIQIRDIHKSFGDNHVLRGISSSFEPGQVSMIIGASGSGKTVLVKTIVGLLQPDSGDIFYDRLNLVKAQPSEVRLLRNSIGMLFQSSALFDSLNVFDNIAFPLRMFTEQGRNEIRNRVTECLERVRLTGTEKLMPSELSGGMKKRVGIARAIAMNPKYLFFDEPNSGLDPQTAGVIDDLIREITRDFLATSVVISHDMKSVMTISDKMMFLYQGEKVWEGTRPEVLTANDQRLLDFIQTSGVNIQQFANV
jgi:phospholipid/cholesterol/gamma-HCH transport system ATP-binding protein